MLAVSTRGAPVYKRLINEIVAVDEYKKIRLNFNKLLKKYYGWLKKYHSKSAINNLTQNDRPGEIQGNGADRNETSSLSSSEIKQLMDTTEDIQPSI